MAALLAMKRHAAMPERQRYPMPVGISMHVTRATSSFEQSLNLWSVNRSLHVGFGVLVPVLLAMLEEDRSVSSFPGRDTIQALNRRRLAKFDPRLFFTKHLMTLVHSLEAFIGEIVSVLLVIMPYSIPRWLIHLLLLPTCRTAAHGITIQKHLLEKRLRMALEQGAEACLVHFPPRSSKLFGALSILVEGGISAERPAHRALSIIGDFWKAQLTRGNGVVGFGEV